MLEHLRSATADLHDQVEEVLSSAKIADGSLSPADYNQLLLINYIIFKAYRTNIVHGSILDTQFIDRTPALERDLSLNNLSPIHAALFEDWSFYKLIGAVYVLNGSSLGGSVIAKQLRSYNFIEEQHFYSHDKHVMTQWKEFKTWLESQEFTAEQQEEIISGAISTFRMYIDYSQKV